jgi:hypothetical protein
MEDQQQQQPMQPSMMQQQPMQPPMQQPYADPYGDQQPAPDMGMAPIGYEDGGTVLPAGVAMTYSGFLPALLAAKGAANLAAARKPVDVAAPAGTVRDPSGPANSSPAEAIAADIVAKAEDLASKVDTTAPEDIGKEIVNTAASKGIESSGDLKFDLASIYERMTGDASGYEKNIDSLNRGIIGAAIGAGTSARATENISNGLLVGLQASKATEERRAGDEQAINAALFEASLKPAGGGMQARDYRSPTDAYQETYNTIMGMSEGELPLDPETGDPVDKEQYAIQQATKLVAATYTPMQLRGTPFEASGGTPEEERILQQARAALAANKSRAAVEEYLTSMGIDPSKL